MKLEEICRCKGDFNILSLRAIARHKIVWNDFEQALLGPQGEGQDARSNLQKSAIHCEIASLDCHVLLAAKGSPQ